MSDSVIRAEDRTKEVTLEVKVKSVPRLGSKAIADLVERAVNTGLGVMNGPDGDKISVESVAIPSPVYAALSWGVGDVLSKAEDLGIKMTAVQADLFLAANGSQIQSDASERGWDSIETLLWVQFGPHTGEQRR